MNLRASFQLGDYFKTLRWEYWHAILQGRMIENRQQRVFDKDPESAFIHWLGHPMLIHCALSTLCLASCKALGVPMGNGTISRVLMEHNPWRERAMNKNVCDPCWKRP